MRQAIADDGGKFYTGGFLPGPVASSASDQTKPASWIRRQLGDETVGLIALPNERWDANTVKACFPEARVCGGVQAEDSSAIQAERP